MQFMMQFYAIDKKQNFDSGSENLSQKAFSKHILASTFNHIECAHSKRPITILMKTAKH